MGGLESSGSENGSIECGGEFVDLVRRKSGHAGCLRWAVEVGSDPSQPQSIRLHARAIIEVAGVSQTDKGDALACDGTYRAGGEIERP